MYYEPLRFKTACKALNIPLCGCGLTLSTPQEREHGMCDGCAIDLWEIQQTERERRYLEDDRNWLERS